MKRIFCFLCLFCSIQAQALLGELRLTYGNTAGEPKDFNNAYFNFQDGPNISGQTYTGIDAIAMLPMVPIGVGLRLENTSFNKTEFNEQVDFSIARTALLINYRIINTGFYFGPIVSYGISHAFDFKIPLDPDVFTAGKQTSLGYGVEGGLKLGLFRLGLELGQLSQVFSDLKDINGAIPNKNGLNISELNFGGTYYKLHIGVGF